MNRMRVALFPDRAGAEVIQKRLLEAGFKAEVHDNPSLGALWFIPRGTVGVRVEVAAAQFEQAEHMLQQWDATEGALREAIHCPECKSLRVEYPQYAEHSLLTNLAVGVSAELGLVEKDYYCEDCHCTWPKPGIQPRPRQHMAPYYFIEDFQAAPQARHQPPST